MSLSPPQPAVPGSPYFLYLTFTDFETGALTDPTALTLDITYGQEAGIVPDVAGTFTYTGASSDSGGNIWRISTGSYAFDWTVPTTGIKPGVYAATWTATYGPNSDVFQAIENFPIVSGQPYVAVPAGDVGYFTGSLSYQPAWATAPFAINFGETDANGVSWVWQSIKGWDSPPTVGSVIQRSADHGGWPAAQFYGPRIITLTVMASAPTQALRDAARASLQQVVPTGTTSTDLATLVYNEPVPKQVQVRRNAQAGITETYPTLSDVVFKIPLVAPDPRKYSTVPSTSASILAAPPSNPVVLPFTSGLPVTFPATGIPQNQGSFAALNYGTFETRPSVTVTGPVVGPQVINAATGQAITFTSLTLGSADVLTLDLDTRQSFFNGAFYAADPTSQWWVLEPGTSTIYLSGATEGGASLVATWSSAWI